MAYHSESETYSVAVSHSFLFHQEDEDEDEEEGGQRNEREIRHATAHYDYMDVPQYMEKYELRLLSPETWDVIDRSGAL